jgi:hypothetical protein
MCSRTFRNYGIYVLQRGGLPKPFIRMEGILRKLQKVMKLTQKWKYFEIMGPHEN